MWKLVAALAVAVAGVVGLFAVYVFGWQGDEPEANNVLVWPLARGPDGPPFAYSWRP